MSIAADKMAEVLALSHQDRAYLVRELLASLDHDQGVDADAETTWNDVLDRRSQEIDQGSVTCRPVNEVVGEIRAQLHARRQPS